MRPLYDATRWRAFELLNLQVGEKVLISGVGTGLDLPLIAPGVHVTGIDLPPAMIEKACGKSLNLVMTFAIMDTQALQFPDCTFDVVI